MRIAIITSSAPPYISGIAQVIETSCAKLKELGHRVLLMAADYDNAKVEKDVIRVPSIANVDHQGGISFPFGWIPLHSRAIQIFNPDIIHCHTPFFLGDVALHAAKKLKIPLIYHHHTRFQCYTHLINAQNSIIAHALVLSKITKFSNKSNYVLAPSSAMVDELLQRKVVTPITVVHCGVDIGKFSKGNGKSFRERVKIPREEFVIGHVGRLSVEKNLKFMAEAVCQGMKSLENSRFVLVGKGPEVKAFCDIFRAHGLRDRLVCVGSLQGQNLVDAYAAMDTFVFASQSETFGIVLVEALAAGVPVVAVSASGVDDIMVDGTNGILLPTEDARTFSDAIRRVAFCGGRTRFEVACRESARRFSVENFINALIQLYSELAGSWKFGKQLLRLAR
ncbi:MAG: glycosyltransferase [Planctomycetota bacterium]|jgi:glycosyltransferase involved in cell wall biosynthesis